MLHKQSFGDIANCIYFWFSIRSNIKLSPSFIVDKFKGFSGIESKFKSTLTFSDDAVALAEDDGGSSKEIVLLSNGLNFFRWGQSSLAKLKTPSS